MKKISAVILACLTGVAVQAQLIDDFSSGSLSAYTFSRVNDGNTTANVTFSDASGSAQVSYSGTATYEQDLLLRQDYSLGVGDMLVGDVLGTPSGWDRDLGIAIGYTATPPSLAAGASGDVRSSFVEVSVRSNNQVVSYARDGSSNLTSGQEFAGTSYGGDSFTAYPTSLYIARLSTTDYEVGWIQGGVRHALTANGAALSYNIATDSPGAAVGLYADVRTAITASPAQIDNLRIEAVPEPTTLALCGVSAFGLLMAVRRKK